jgi:hypothetical protein
MRTLTRFFDVEVSYQGNGTLMWDLAISDQKGGGRIQQCQYCILDRSEGRQNNIANHTCIFHLRRWRQNNIELFAHLLVLGNGNAACREVQRGREEEGIIPTMQHVPGQRSRADAR